MPPSRSAELEALFARLERIDVAAAPRPALARTRSGWVIPRLAATAVAVLALPFVVLVRTATLLYVSAGFPTWLALGAAGVATLSVLTVYAAAISKRLTGRRRVAMVARWVAFPLVVAYCGYGLLYVADVNTKTPEIQAYYRALHPVLRVAVSTFILADDGLVITDVARTPGDYATMGLPLHAASRHFRQDDGWVHALDLRTIGRAEWKNRLTAVYFRAMGFRTLRHEGTADHLHVSLAVR